MGRTALVAFLTSLFTTSAAFFALTVADRRGLLSFLPAKSGEPAAIDGVEVPPINGVSVDQARELLRARDLLLTVQAEQPDPLVPAGKIAGQTPLAGSRTPRGSAVQAFVSTGAGAVTIPALAGTRPDDAVEQLRARKLAAGHRRDEASETVAAGLVVGTEPPAGRAVAVGADVVLLVSTGPTPRKIPKLLGFRVSRAKKVLEEAGFKLGSTRIGSSDNFDEEVIIKQDPAADALAVPGTPINVIVNE